MSNTESSEEKMFLTIASLGAIAGFIIPLIMWAMKKDNFSEYTNTFLLKLLNFELVIFIVCVLFCWIPILGWILSLFIFIWNLIISLNAFSATQSQKEYKFPIALQLVK